MTRSFGMLMSSTEISNAIAAPALDMFASITDKQRQVLDQLAAGLTNKEIASQLGLSPSTIKTHILCIYQRTRCSNRIQLALKWLQYRGFITLTHPAR